MPLIARRGTTTAPSSESRAEEQSTSLAGKPKEIIRFHASNPVGPPPDKIKIEALEASPRQPSPLTEDLKQPNLA